MLVLNKIGQKFQSEDKKQLLENFLSLSVLQSVNYIFTFNHSTLFAQGFRIRKVWFDRLCPGF